MTSSTSSSPAVSRARVADVRNRPRRRREVSAAAARSKGPRRRARGGVGPSLRDDVAVTFIVDRALLDEDDEGAKAMAACHELVAADMRSVLLDALVACGVIRRVAKVLHVVLHVALHFA